jgi:hypothetical protein
MFHVASVRRPGAAFHPVLAKGEGTAVAESQHGPVVPGTRPHSATEAKVYDPRLRFSGALSGLGKKEADLTSSRATDGAPGAYARRQPSKKSAS